MFDYLMFTDQYSFIGSNHIEIQ